MTTNRLLKATLILFTIHPIRLFVFRTLLLLLPVVLLFFQKFGIVLKLKRMKILDIILGKQMFNYFIWPFSYFNFLIDSFDSILNMKYVELNDCDTISHNLEATLGAHYLIVHNQKNKCTQDIWRERKIFVIKSHNCLWIRFIRALSIHLKTMSNLLSLLVSN